MSTREAVQRFYRGLQQKNDDWQKDLAEDVQFSDASARLRADGRDAFIQSFSTFLRAVEKVEMKQLIVEGDNACGVVSYDYVSPTGGRLHQDDAEVWRSKTARSPL